MTSQLWCRVCNQAVSVGVNRAAAAVAIPLAGTLAASIPRLLGRKRHGLLATVVQGVVGAGAGYLASRYLAPKLKHAVCGRCGASAVEHPAAA